MNVKKIKKLIRSDRELVKSLMLTDYQLEVVEFVERFGEVTSSDVSKWQECSIQSAHAILLRLKINEWLSRKEVKDPTGGKMFIYSVKKD